MIGTSERGRTYRCLTCGTEVTVLVSRHGDFIPRCCGRDMAALKRRPVFFACPVCGSQVAVWNPFAKGFMARCCNTPMRQMAA